MNPNERCLYEEVAERLVKDQGIEHPAQCPIKEECFANPLNVCLRVVKGEGVTEVVGSLVKSAAQSQAIVEGLFLHKDP